MLNLYATFKCHLQRQGQVKPQESGLRSVQYFYMHTPQQENNERTKGWCFWIRRFREHGEYDNLLLVTKMPGCTVDHAPLLTCINCCWDPEACLWDSVWSKKRKIQSNWTPEKKMSQAFQNRDDYVVSLPSLNSDRNTIHNLFACYNVYCYLWSSVGYSILDLWLQKAWLSPEE